MFKIEDLYVDDKIGNCGSIGSVQVRAVYVCDTMKKLLLAGVIVSAASSAHAACQYWNCMDVEDNWKTRAEDAVHRPYEYSEATLENAPAWMKLNCHRREHRWAAYRHLYSMCR
jgi:hypothetical protein